MASPREQLVGQTMCLHCRKTFGSANGLVLAKTCETCLDSLPLHTDDEVSFFLESLDLPAAFISRDLSIRLSNSSLNKMVNKVTPDLLGARIGDALECAYESEHQNCGENYICLQCGVRRMVDLARITGYRLVDIPITLRSKSGDERRLLFTFAKAGEAILILLKSAEGSS